VKTKVSPAVVGLFVLGAFIVGLVALFSFGGVNFFSKPERFIVYFDESIHGLDLGSPVKLRGVRIGRVVDLNVRALPAGQRSVVAVVCELSRNVVADGQGKPVDVSDRKELERLIREGLRAQLGVIGLATGLLYVELDFYNPKDHPVRSRASVESAYLEMPALPSKSAEFLRSIEEILADMRRADIPGLAVELKGLVQDTRRQINAADIGALSREFTEAAKAVRVFAEAPELKVILANAASASARMDRVFAELEKSVGPGGEQFNLVLKDARGSLAEFTATAAVFRRFVVSQQTLGDDAAKALARMGEAAAAIARLADFLERNPNALLSGRAKE
jgi:paraquat-inducible protein B